MEHSFYLRPREKIRERGVASLSLVELLQALIGSGSRHVSAARIAKNTVRVLSEKYSYESLLKVNGLGHAKAAQILAAIELGRRMHEPKRRQVDKPPEFSIARVALKPTLEYVAYNGDGTSIKRRSRRFGGTATVDMSVRAMFADVLGDRAARLEVAIGYHKQNGTVLDDAMLYAIRKIFETADLLEIRIEEVWAVSADSQRSIPRKAVQL
jgi:DNA repair protein RadC